MQEMTFHGTFHSALWQYLQLLPCQECLEHVMLETAQEVFENKTISIQSIIKLILKFTDIKLAS